MFIEVNLRRFCLLIIVIFSVPLFSEETGAIEPSNYLDHDVGTEANPFLISNLANLRWLSELSEEWVKPELSHVYFLQTDDIDATETINWHDGTGFRPIGHFHYFDPPWFFMGVYDGAGYNISNLYISTDIDINGEVTLWVGLFSRIGNSHIKNVNLINVNFNAGIASDLTLQTSVGGIAGSSFYSKITNCHVSGKITSTAMRYSSVGGLVGNTMNFDTIENSSFIGQIYGTSVLDWSYVGGIVGRMSLTVISNCFSKGSIESMSDEGYAFAGGIVGYITQDSGSDVKKSYSASKIKTISNQGYSYAGGLVGHIFYTGYGRWWPISLIESFWDKELSGIPIIAGFNHGGYFFDCFGLTSDEMKQISTFTSYDWNFENIWDIDVLINEGYPFLRGMPEPVVNCNDFDILPNMYSLNQNFPNPFNPETTISFSVVVDSIVSIDIYNIRGQKVKTLVNEFKSSGNHQVVWNGTDEKGYSIGGGVYFYMMKTDNFTETRRMVLVK